MDNHQVINRINEQKLTELIAVNKLFRDDYFLFMKLKVNNSFTIAISKKYSKIINKIDRILKAILDDSKCVEILHNQLNIKINLLHKIIVKYNKKFLSNYALLDDLELKSHKNIFLKDSVNNNNNSECVFITQNEFTGSYYVVNDELYSVYTIVDVNSIDNGIYTIYLKE